MAPPRDSYVKSAILRVRRFRLAAHPGRLLADDFATANGTSFHPRRLSGPFQHTKGPSAGPCEFGLTRKAANSEPRGIKGMCSLSPFFFFFFPSLPFLCLSLLSLSSSLHKEHFTHYLLSPDRTKEKKEVAVEGRDGRLTHLQVPLALISAGSANEGLKSLPEFTSQLCA